MTKEWGSEREKVISIMELFVCILGFISIIISLVAFMALTRVYSNLTYSTDTVFGLLVSIIRLIIRSLLYVACLIVAVRNFLTKRSNNEILIIIVGLLLAISNLLSVSVISLACNVVLVVLVIQRLRGKNKLSIGARIVLSIVTLGVLFIYWEYLLVKNTRAIQNDGSSCTGEVLCLVLVPFYNLYWWYTRGRIVKDKFIEQGYSAKGSEVAYLVLALFGLNIVAAAIMQTDFDSINSESSQPNQESTGKSGVTVSEEK